FPFQLMAVAMRAYAARDELNGAACAALLIAQNMFSATLPERPVVGGGPDDGFVHFRLLPEPMSSGRRECLHRHGRVRAWHLPPGARRPPDATDGRPPPRGTCRPPRPIGRRTTGRHGCCREVSPPGRGRP